jgi:hypothetical protein
VNDSQRKQVNCEKRTACSATVRDDQVVAFECGEKSIDFPFAIDADVKRVGMEALERGVFVVGVDREMKDAAIL